MPSCNKDKANTRILVHVKHAFENAIAIFQICSVDTDIVVIITTMFHDLSQINSDVDFWVAYGVGKNNTH